MKISMIKHPGGVLIPASDMEQEKLTRFRSGELYHAEIKRHRNPQHHRKVFAFFNFCFAHWSASSTDLKFMDEAAQFDTFRNNLTCLAGPAYRVETYGIKGSVRIEAKSISFSSMDQAEFEQLYSALINAALKHIFLTTDENTYNQLLSFF